MRENGKVKLSNMGPIYPTFLKKIFKFVLRFWNSWILLLYKNKFIMF
jgi:hypothetical protein